MTRFPSFVFARGIEPDARFTLANERTFLAWIRTGLALMAGGVALESFGLGLNPALRITASLLLISASLLTPIQAWVGWMRIERALRRGRSLPAPFTAFPLVVVTFSVGVVVLVGVLFK